MTSGDYIMITNVCSALYLGCDVIMMSKNGLDF